MTFQLSSSKAPKSHHVRPFSRSRRPWVDFNRTGIWRFDENRRFGKSDFFLKYVLPLSGPLSAPKSHQFRILSPKSAPWIDLNLVKTKLIELVVLFWLVLTPEIPEISPGTKMAARLCCFHWFVNMKCLPFPVSTSKALKFLRFLIAAKNVSLYSRKKNGESSVLFSPVCKHEMFAFPSFHIKRDGPHCLWISQLLARSGLDSMDPTRQDPGAAVTRRMASSIYQVLISPSGFLISCQRH